MNLVEIIRYPIKGLNGESLDGVYLEKSQGLSLDRTFAITHATSKFDIQNPRWIARRNFVVVAYSPKINQLSVRHEYASGNIQIFDSESLLSEFDSEESDISALPEIVLGEHTGKLQKGPHQVVRVPNVSLTDSPIQSVSIMSLSSLNTVSESTGVSLSLQRFRGNMWIDGFPPWSEFDWIGKEIQMGNARLKVVERITRCAAINANPLTGDLDVEVTRVLIESEGHCDFGVLAEIIGSGDVCKGSNIEV